MTLAAPTGLRVDQVSRTAVIGHWNPVPGASYYRIYTDHASENVGSANSTRATWQSLTPGTTYRIHVRAVDNTGTYGPASPQVTVTTKK